MSNADDPRSHVQELIRQREQIRDWIARLDDAGAPDVPDRVARRVRADYEERMTRVTEELGGHRDALQGELDDLQGSVAETEKRLEEGRDALAETRLRHTIGELDDEAWEEARPELESAAAGAEEELARLRDEAERLARLVSEIEAAPEAGEEAAGVAEAAEPEAEPVAPAEGLEPDSVPDWMRDDETTVESFPTAAAAEAAPSSAASADEGEETPAEDLPWLDALETEEAAAREEDDDAGLEFLREVDADAAPAPSPSAPEAPEAGGAALGDDDLAFLEELDRAISGEGAAEAMSPPAPAPEPEPAAPSGSDGGGADSTSEAPAQGRLLCRECGALNEPHAWYCEICGSEL